MYLLYIPRILDQLLNDRKPVGHLWKNEILTVRVLFKSSNI